MRKNAISMPQNSYIYPDYIQLGGLMELNQCNITAEFTEPLSTRIEELITILNDDFDQTKKFTEKEWLKHLDEAMDTLISICNISSETANRAINASVSRG